MALNMLTMKDVDKNVAIDKSKHITIKYRPDNLKQEIKEQYGCNVFFNGTYNHNDMSNYKTFKFFDLDLLYENSSINCDVDNGHLSLTLWYYTINGIGEFRNSNFYIYNTFSSTTPKVFFECKFNKDMLDKYKFPTHYSGYIDTVITIKKIYDELCIVVGDNTRNSTYSITQIVHLEKYIFDKVYWQDLIDDHPNLPVGIKVDLK